MRPGTSQASGNKMKARSPHERLSTHCQQLQKEAFFRTVFRRLLGTPLFEALFHLAKEPRKWSRMERLLSASGSAMLSTKVWSVGGHRSASRGVHCCERERRKIKVAKKKDATFNYHLCVSFSFPCFRRKKKLKEYLHGPSRSQK